MPPRPVFLTMGALILVQGANALACSGPHAAQIIRESEIIGWSFAAVSIAIVGGGYHLLRRRSLGSRMPWIVAPMMLHPRWWMDAIHGDCGYGLRAWSLVATFLMAIVVILAIVWPGRAEAVPKKGKWVLSGALFGGLFGLLVAAALVGPMGVSAVILTLAVSALCSTILLGAMVGGGLFQLRRGDGPRFTFRLRTLLLLPLVLAPLIVVLLPVLPYEASVSMTTPFFFLVVDDQTGRPIPNAVVQLIDPRFAIEDTEQQGERVKTGTDGRAEYFLYANVEGREGLLGRTETIRYDPWLIRVEAAGYHPFFTSLDRQPPILEGRLTARPLGLTFPPPSSVTIRLSPSRKRESETPLRRR